MQVPHILCPCQKAQRISVSTALLKTHLSCFAAWLQELLCLGPFQWRCWSKVLVCLLWCLKSASPSSSFSQQWLLSCPCLLANTKVTLNHTFYNRGATSQHCEAALLQSVLHPSTHPFIHPSLHSFNHPFIAQLYT